MQKDIAKGRGLLTILTLSFSYPYVSLHIMTLVTKCVVAAIPVRLISDFSEPVPMVCPPSLPPSQGTAGLWQPLALQGCMWQVLMLLGLLDIVTPNNFQSVPVGGKVTAK